MSLPLSPTNSYFLFPFFVSSCCYGFISITELRHELVQMSPDYEASVTWRYTTSDLLELGVAAVLERFLSLARVILAGELH